MHHAHVTCLKEGCCEGYYILGVCSCSQGKIPSETYDPTVVALPRSKLDPIIDSLPAPAGWPSPCPGDDGCDDVLSETHATNPPPFYGCNIPPPHKGLIFLMVDTPEGLICAIYCKAREQIIAQPASDVLVATGVERHDFLKCNYFCGIDEITEDLRYGCCEPDSCPAPLSPLCECNPCTLPSPSVQFDCDDGHPTNNAVLGAPLEARIDINHMGMLLCSQQTFGINNCGANNPCIECGGESTGPPGEGGVDPLFRDGTRWHSMYGGCPALNPLFQDFSATSMKSALGAPNDCSAWLCSGRINEPETNPMMFGSCCGGVAQCCPQLINANCPGSETTHPPGWGVGQYLFTIGLWCVYNDVLDTYVWRAAMRITGHVSCGDPTPWGVYPQCGNPPPDQICPMTAGENRYRFPLHCTNACGFPDSFPQWTQVIWNMSREVKWVYSRKREKWVARLGDPPLSLGFNRDPFLHGDPGCNLNGSSITSCLGLNVTVQFRDGPGTNYD